MNSLVVVLVCGLACDEHARDRELESKKAEHAKRTAEAAAEQAMKNAADARERLDTVMRELEAFDAKVSAAVTAMAEAQNDAERAAAKVQLELLQTEQVALKQRVAEARAAAQRAERMKGVKISKECLDNPLAKGCS